MTSCSSILFTEAGPAIDGQWSDWDAWSSCSATCDGGTQQSVRRCDDPAAQNGGSECVGDSSESRDCSQWDCPGIRYGVLGIVYANNLYTCNCINPEGDQYVKMQ